MGDSNEFNNEALISICRESIPALPLDPADEFVWLAATGVKIANSERTFSLKEGEVQLTAHVLPYNGSNPRDNAINQEVTWDSSDPEIAYIDREGKLTLTSPGKVIITATSKDGGYCDSIEITVKASHYSLAIGESLKSIGGYVKVNDERVYESQLAIAGGAPVSIEAVPYPGYEFDGWNTENVVLHNQTANSTTFIMPEQAVTIMPVFKLMPPTIPVILLGDINGDSRVNLSDLSFLAQYFIGGYGIEERFPMIYMTGDMNQNGILELDDLSLLVHLIVNFRPTTNGNGLTTIVNKQQMEAQAMTIAAFDITTPADDGATVITVPAVAGKPGERVVVPVAIESSPGVKMYQLAMQYDNSKLEFISQSSGSAFAQPASLRNGGPIQVDGDIWEARVTYLSELLAPQTVPGDVILCEFEFEIRDGAAAGEIPLILKPQNSYILNGSGNNVYPEIKDGSIIIEATEDAESYNFRAYMEAAQTSLNAGDTLSVDIILSGDLNYTQFNTAIAYDSAWLEFAGYANLGGLVAEVKKDGADKITVRSVASMNMMTGVSCVTPVRVVTLKFTVKDILAAESVASDLSFASIAVTPAAGVSGAITAPGRALCVTISR